MFNFDWFTTLISDIFSGVSGKALEGVLDIATDVVIDLEVITGMEGPEKREEAYERIVAQAEEEGKEIIKQSIYCAIETVLTSIRK